MKCLYMGNEIEVTNTTEEYIFYKQGDNFKKMKNTKENNSAILPVEKTNIELANTVNNTFSKLAAGLMDDFDKLSNDPEYVNQAKQRCNTVNTVIDMFKVQMSIK